MKLMLKLWQKATFIFGGYFRAPPIFNLNVFKNTNMVACQPEIASKNASTATVHTSVWWLQHGGGAVATAAATDVAWAIATHSGGDDKSGGGRVVVKAMVAAEGGISKRS